VRKHPNADRLNLATVHGHQVVVGLEAKEGDRGVFFPCDGQLSEAMAEANDLVGYTDPATGEKKGGFFAKNRRVRAQKFRGEKSDGFFIELDKLAFTGYDLSTLEDGFAFTELGGVQVCQKYYTPATRAKMSRPGQARKQRNLIFPEHIDTAQFRYNSHRIPVGAVVYITEKAHGTSGRYGNVAETTPMSGWQKFWAKLAGFIGRFDPATEFFGYQHLSGSRRVVLDKQPEAASYYGTNSFREDVVAGIELHKGEVLYFEIVGDVAEGQPIMPVHTVKDELKDIQKQYGKKMDYRYGTLSGEHKMLVYRVTRLNEDGVETDLSWQQVKQRCKELGLQTVPELDMMFTTDDSDISRQMLTDTVEALTDGPSTLDSSHIREGVVVRVESDQGTWFFKNKSWAFGVLEGYIKDSDTYVDTEEAA
jgi:hypothetical protein